MSASEIEMERVDESCPDDTMEQPPPVKRSWSVGSYSKLSEFMGSWSDVAIFRRFSNLNAENLLFLQAELLHLEDDLQRAREKAANSGDQKAKLTLQSWCDLMGDEDNELLAILMDIRAKLKEYNSFLLQYKDLCKMHGPSKYDLDSLCDWLKRPKGGDNFLQGVEREAWDAARPQTVSDLVSMSESHGEQDLFSTWISEDVLDWFHRAIGHRIKKPYDLETGIYHYKESSLKAVSHMCGILFAAVVPAASIFALYYIRDMVARLGAILAFSALFSICLAIFTTARRVEIFAATAAYAFIFALAALLLH